MADIRTVANERALPLSAQRPHAGSAAPQAALAPAAPEDRFVASASKAVPGQQPEPNPLNRRQEPTYLHGRVYTRSEEGDLTTLANNGGTVPDTPDAAHASIPAEAVEHNRVFIYVDGIQETIRSQERGIKSLFQSPADLDTPGIDVGQAVVGVHEGVGASRAADLKRIVFDIALLKALQTPFMKAEHAAALVALHDPAVKALHDELRQSLELGRDVTIAAHSGGGAESALALTILAKEDKGRFRKDISEHVRMISLSGASAPRDFEKAGIAKEDLYYTGSSKDPLFLFARDYLSPVNPIADVPVLFNGMRALYRVARGIGMSTHDANYIFTHSRRADGSEPIQEFVDGGPGGFFPLDQKHDAAP